MGQDAMGIKSKAIYDKHNLSFAGLASDYYEERGVDAELKKVGKNV